MVRTAPNHRRRHQRDTRRRRTRDCRRHDIRADEVALQSVNERLWDIEDRIRDKERAGSFDAGFVELARAVYIENDERAAIKKRINTALGSKIVEEKSYAAYR